MDLATDVTNCGSCGNACTAEAPAAPACVDGTCGLACPAGRGDCDGDPSTGCETDTSADLANCGGCDIVCAFAHASGRCDGSCIVATCDAGFGDCNALGSDGCEADLSSNIASCGACAFSCELADATAGCAAGACTIEACLGGHLDCNAIASDGCEVDPTTDAVNCGACGNVCPGAARPNTVASCRTGTCEIACASGFGDCDGMSANGCEQSVTGDEANGGACGVVCPAGEICVSGTCASRRFTGAVGTAWEMIPAGGA